MGLLNGSQHTINASAVGGQVRRVQDSVEPGFSHSVEGTFARADLFVGCGQDSATGLNSGILTVNVERWDGNSYVAVAGYPINLSTYYNGELSFYYDNPVRIIAGTQITYDNAAIFQIMSLPFDQYRITVTLGGPDTTEDPGATDCLYWLNGIATYELDTLETYYWADPTTRHEVSTEGNAERVTPESQTKDHRNHVVVVGGRKAALTGSDVTLTDSSGLSDEFRFAVASDPFSMHVPTTSNYAGSKRAAVIFDDKITDDSFAAWVAAAVLFRYRNPADAASIEHTALPMLELRDPLHVLEAKHETVNHILWVQSFTEKWTTKTAKVTIEGASYPEIPSYMPRENIPIDLLFDHNGDGRGDPVVNVRIEYENIYKEFVDNDVLSSAVKLDPELQPASPTYDPIWLETAAPNIDSQQQLTAAAMPETIFLVSGPQSIAPPILGDESRYGLVNHPYRHFFDIIGYGQNHEPILQFDFQEGDGTAGVYDEDYYQWPTGFSIAYHKFATRADLNPYYDPYTSEQGNYVRFLFDALVSGFYRLSVWYKDPKTNLSIPVAWLSEPGADPSQPEEHWTFLDGGNNKIFVWDGVDNIGLYNRLKTQDYGALVSGAFGGRDTVVGTGFYAANDEAQGTAQIGDVQPENYGPDTAPYYTMGFFSHFYVKIEAINDAIMRQSIYRDPRETVSNKLPFYCCDDSTKAALDWHNVATPTSTDNRGSVLVWYHLSEPTQVTMRIEDWNPDALDPAGGFGSPGGFASPAGDWNAFTTNDWAWEPQSDANATIRNGKPVRVKFYPVPRRGKHFESESCTLDPDRIRVKLTREVHLKATVYDQFWTFFGRNWEGIHKDNVADVEEKRVTSRMYHVDDDTTGTLAYEDTEWRRGRDVLALEWIFHPAFFKKDFGLGIEEELRYADYEQILSLTNFKLNPDGGALNDMREFLTLAYMSYLFFFSAFVLDRSGRRQWCISRRDNNGVIEGFIERNKIVSPEWLAATDASHPQYVVNYERREAEKYVIRSIYARQWLEPTWLTSSDGTLDGYYPGSPIRAWSITDPHELQFVQISTEVLNPWRSALLHPAAKIGGGGINTVTHLPYLDRWLKSYRTDGDEINDQLRNARSGAGGVGGTQRTLDQFPHLDDLGQQSGEYIMPGQFGTWHFDRGGYDDFFAPSPVRDFHPYWRFPQMPEYGGFDMRQYHPLEKPPIAQWGMALNVLMSTSSHFYKPLRDPAAFQDWHGRVHAERINPSPEFIGALVEDTVAEWARQSGRGSDLYYSFDCQRIDELDRYDMFRGCMSRQPYPDRDAEPDSNWWDSAPLDGRVTGPAVHKASGIYFTNLGDYDKYFHAKVHNDHRFPRFQFVRLVNFLNEMRFEREFVWYNSYYFPVTPRGGAFYNMFRDQQTRMSLPSGRGNIYWWRTRARYSTSYVDERAFSIEPFYDPGAWTGWKPDIRRPNDWDSPSPHLRWHEVPNPFLPDLDALDTWISAPHLPAPSYANGGGDYFAPPDDVGQAIGSEYWMGQSQNTKRQNINDEVQSPGWYRTAVGPRTGQEAYIYLNLTLPARLGGFTSA